MNVKMIVTKSKMMIASMLAISSMLMIAASPALAAAAAPAKADREGPFTVTPISLNATTDDLAAMYHHNLDLYREFRGATLEAKGLNSDFMRVVNSSDRNSKTTTADLHVYQADLKRAMDISSDLASIFSTHAGFNREGDVTNEAQARTTLNLMDGYLRNGLFWARQATYELKTARDNRLS